MARPRRPWWRFYVEMPRDQKIRHLKPAQRWLWCCVLSAGRESPIAGWLMVSERVPLSVEGLADYAGMTVREVTAGIKAMDHLGLIEWDTAIGTWFSPSFLNRQFESDDVTARTQKHRSKESVGNVP